MTEVSIKKIKRHEFLALSVLAKTSFSDTFAHTCSAEDMDFFLRTQYEVPVLLKEWKLPNRETWLAKSGDALLGYMQLNVKATVAPLRGVFGVEVQRLYVDRPYLGMQVGAKLMEHAHERARKTGSNLLWLSVWEHNEKAKTFYARFGFVPIGFHDFPIGKTPQTDILMKKTLGSKKRPLLTS